MARPVVLVTGGSGMLGRSLAKRLHDDYTVSQIVEGFVYNELEGRGLFGLAAIAGWAVRAFGPPEEFPQSLQGEDVRFKFESPLHQAIERQKGQKFLETKGLLREAAEIDPASVAIVDARIALRDALSGIGIDAKWMRSEEAVEAQAQKMQQQQEAQAALAVAQQGAEVAETAGKAEQAMAAA